MKLEKKYQPKAWGSNPIEKNLKEDEIISKIQF
jgi:hypothetical protein